jgi:hypothetical protein
MALPRRTAALALIVGCALLSLSACTQVKESESQYSPTSVEPVPGRADVQQVTFTKQAAQRVDLTTSTVTRSGSLTSIPYAALIYDDEGHTYTYATRKPLVFVRERIAVAHIARGRVVLRHGPSIGTNVVTTGAAEVYSAEFGVEE